MSFLPRNLVTFRVAHKPSVVPLKGTAVHSVRLLMNYEAPLTLRSFLGVAFARSNGLCDERGRTSTLPTEAMLHFSSVACVVWSIRLLYRTRLLKNESLKYRRSLRKIEFYLSCSPYGVTCWTHVQYPPSAIVPYCRDRLQQGTLVLSTSLSTSRFSSSIH